MRDACIRSVEAAIGRPITQAEARNIETRVGGAMRILAAKDPGSWRALSPTDRLSEAGKLAGEQILAEAQKVEQRIGLSILAKQRIEGYQSTQGATYGGETRLDSLQRVLAPKYDEKNNIVSVETRANGHFAEALSQLADVFEAINPDFFKRIATGTWTLAPLRKAWVDALHDPNAKVPPEIRKAADVYHAVAEAFRETFNAYGGAVGRLEDWGMPHSWSARLGRRVGRDQWVADMLNWTDARRYVHEDGTLFTQDQRREFLEQAWLSVVTEGANKTQGAAPFPGGSVKANRHSYHRVIHLRPEAAWEALRRYSDDNPLEAIVKSMRRMTRDIALVEVLGPNSDNMFKSLLSDSVAKEATADPDATGKLEDQAVYLQSLYDTIAGNTPMPKNRPFADAMAVLRSIQVASKLGSAVISSVSDFGTLHTTAIANRLDPFKVALNSSLAWAPKSRRFARRMGLMVATMTGHAERYAADNLTMRDVSSRTASFVIRSSGLNFVTEARRLGFSMTMMDAIGHLTRQYGDVGKLRADDYRILASKGIDQATWDIWRAARLDRWGVNATLLTPDAIMAVQGPTALAKAEAVSKFLGIVNEEQDIAVITPGARERTQLTFGTRAGTPQGELVRSIALFKSFPWTVTQRHWERGIGQSDQLGRYAYWASVFLTMSALGLVANWINDLLQGRDPRSINPAHPKGVSNILSGTLKGGGLGIYGDFLFSETTLYGNNTLAETILGPNVATVAQVLDLTAGNAVQAAQGKETNVGAEATRFVRSLTPGANLFYIKGLMDRAIWNQIQDEISPGYVYEMQRRRQRLTGSDYWWQEDELTPERAPDLANVASE